jgi:lipopolysaccharide exporter
MNILQSLKTFLTPSEKLSHRVLSASFWMVSIRVASRLLGIVRIIVLARLLAPADFGLMGIALLVGGLLDGFTGIGLQTALVQRKGDIRGYLNPAWTAYLIQQSFLSIILFASGDWIGSFFNSPLAGQIVRVMGLANLITGFTNIGMVYFDKELQFNKKFIYEIAVSLTDIIVTIPAAFILRSAWALVFGALASNLAGVIVSYIIQPYRPRFSFDMSKIKELFQFGRWILLNGMVLTLYKRSDSFFVGKILGAQSLGFYQLANRFSDEPILEIKTVIGSVTFPTFSKLQDNKPALSHSFLKAIELISGLAMPAAVIILFLAPDFVRVVLGEKWLQSASAMQILGFAAASRVTITACDPLFWGLGRPNIIFYMNLVRMLALLALIYPLTKMFGIAGTSVAVLIGVLASWPILFWSLKKYLNINGIRLLRSLVIPVITSLAMAGGILGLKHVIREVGLIQLISLALIASLFYLLINCIFHWRLKKGPVTTLVGLIS